MSKEYTAKGKVIHVGGLEKFESGFQKRQIVIEIEDNGYTDNLAMDVIKDKADAAGNLNRGDQVEVSFNIRSNEHNGRYFTNLNCWKWNVTSSAQIPTHVSNEPEF